MRAVPKNISAGLSFFLLLVSMVFFAGSVAYSDGPPQVATLNELITRFDGTSCKECHEEIYAQWEKSHHARPLMGLDDQIFMASYLKRGPLSVKPEEKTTRKNFPYFKCHLISSQLTPCLPSFRVRITRAIFCSFWFKVWQ